MVDEQLQKIIELLSSVEARELFHDDNFNCADSSVRYVITREPFQFTLQYNVLFEGPIDLTTLLQTFDPRKVVSSQPSPFCACISLSVVDLKQGHRLCYYSANAQIDASGQHLQNPLFALHSQLETKLHVYQHGKTRKQEIEESTSRLKRLLGL